MVALFLPLCDLAFRCGCTWFFAGGSDRCNIHKESPPHCPLCVSPAYRGAFGSAIFLVLLLGTGATLSRLAAKR